MTCYDFNSFRSLALAGALALACMTGAVADEKPALTDAEQVAGIQKMCADSGPAMQARQAKKSFYDRLGKRAKVRALVAQVIDAHLKNPKIGHFFEHIDKKRAIKNTTDFLVAGTGGKARYRGREIGALHRGMKVANGDFLAAGADVQAVMKKMGYGENEIQEMVCALTSFVPVVVTQ